MRYHVVINGCSPNWKKQIEELEGFADLCLKEEEGGEAIIICTEESKKEDFGRYAPIPRLRFLTVEYYQPEQVLSALEEIVCLQDIYLFASDYAGNELAVRLGKRLNGCSASGVMEIRKEEEGMVLSKMVYSNYMKGHFRVHKFPCFISTAKGICGQLSENPSWDIAGEYKTEQEQVSFTSQRTVYSVQEEEGLEDQKFVIAAGKGIGSREAMDELREIACRSGAVLGVSRPAAMNAWSPMHTLIGVSGAMIQPDICIAAGISGSAALYAGIEKSKFIVAVNKDPNAPIMKKADAVIADDYKEVMEELARRLEGRTNES